ncbi:MAG: hypothetical protein IPG97_00600 [Microthrixaceae bacterium]|jgi:hypothetical protein|nr:hypothetical protein [Microthrixaceae bacterium]
MLPQNPVTPTAVAVPLIEPVRFDDGAAAALSAALAVLADELDRFRRRTEANADLARRDWAGYSRQWFDSRAAELQERITLAARRAEDDRQEVEQARSWAVAEQQRRVDAAAAEAAQVTAAAEAAQAEATTTEAVTVP